MPGKLSNAKILSVTVLILSCGGAVSADSDSLRAFTVSDSVEMSYFGNVYESSPAHSYDDRVVSPDGKHIVVMTHRGVLPAGYSEGTIWLFDVDDVLASVNDEETEVPTPAAIVRMSATVNGQTGDFDDRGNILFQPRWSDDGQSLYFIGRDDSENRQLFEVDVRTGELKRISLPDQNVMSYLPGRQSVVYLASPGIDEQREWLSAGEGIPDVIVGTGTPLNELLFPNFRGYANASPLVLTAWQVTPSGPTVINHLSTEEPLQIESTYIDVAGIAAAGEPYDAVVLKLAAHTDWVAGTGYVAGERGRLGLTVGESLNSPPVLIATDTGSGESRALFDPNPQLANIAMAEVREFEWQDKYGRTHVAGLVLPADHVAGQRHPLVIQTHGFNKRRFFKMGYSRTANAGRALAGRGLAVLQVQEPRPERDGVYDAARLGSDVYLSAVDQLAKNGLVDPDKVGISGYSFSGWLAADAITREPDRFAAAVIANTDPLSLTGYFSYVDSPLHGLVEPTYVGTAPFGEGINEWLKRSPNFNTDRISAPVLVSALDPFHLISLWDLYAALRYQGKPVELQFMRTGNHNVIKPLQVVAHHEMMVDWFDFWLAGDESSGQGKAEQYSRWRAMRARRGGDDQ
ncbi:MAG: hypothetical protein EX272_01355 [Chromatiales bacterium]|nr:MAG: hypothetical protein EX272_01355 [Chromatiales bacterium]